MLILQELNENDLMYRVNLLNDERISPFLNVSQSFTLNKTKKWFFKIKDDKSRIDFVFLNDNDKIGMGGLTNISIDNSRCQLYMYLDPNFQGRGFGYEFCIALCYYAFQVLNLNKVFLYTFTSNIRANKLYEKVGFKLEGVLSEHTYKRGVPRDRNIYGLHNLNHKCKVIIDH